MDVDQGECPIEGPTSTCSPRPPAVNYKGRLANCEQIHSLVFLSLPLPSDMLVHSKLLGNTVITSTIGSSPAHSMEKPGLRAVRITSPLWSLLTTLPSPLLHAHTHSRGGVDPHSHERARGGHGGRHQRKVLRVWPDQEPPSQPRPSHRIRQGASPLPFSTTTLHRLFFQGYALVEYEMLSEAQAAINGASGSPLLEQTIHCDFAFVRPPPSGPKKGRAREARGRSASPTRRQRE